MKISNDNIIFRSKIKMINAYEFNRLTANLDKKSKFVDYPWTAETMKYGKDLYTTNLMNCIVKVITDGTPPNTVMLHLATRTPQEAKRDFVSRFSIKNIEQRIREKIDLTNKSLHSFLIGGFGHLEKSSIDNTNQFNHLKGISEKYGIPCTTIGLRKDVHYYGHYGVYYNNDADTLYLTNTLTESDRRYNFEDKIIHEIEVVDDGIAYGVYKKIPNEICGWIYGKEFKKSDLETFLKHEFEDVSLSALDQWA